jgi:hypothetical protein
MLTEEQKRQMRGLHATYIRPDGKKLLSYWLEESGKDKLDSYCGKYAGDGGPCENCGHTKEDHKPILVADCVWYGTDSFGKKRQSWRVRGHYKKHIHPHFTDPEPPKVGPDKFCEDRFCWDFVANTLLETKLAAMEYDPEREFTYCFVWKPCRPEEAEAVSLTAVCGAIAPLECVEYKGPVGWSEEHIQEDRERALRHLKIPRMTTHSDFMWD